MEKSFKNILENLKFDDVVLLKGKFVNFQGNITKIDLEDEVFELYVTHSDDVDAIGETLPINDEVMSAMFQSLEIKNFEQSRDDILALIDFSLHIKDKDWFMKLTSRLNEYDTRQAFLKSRTLVV